MSLYANKPNIKAQHIWQAPGFIQTLIMLSLAATKSMAALLSARVVLFNSLKPVGQAQV